MTQNTDIQQTKALELIAAELVRANYDQKAIKEKLHQAAFLATIEAVSQTIGSKVTPTPLYRISYDKESSSLEFRFLDGKGIVPSANAIDIDYADLVFSSIASNSTPILTEGITGTGKTYTLDNIMKALYDSENRKMLRLNPNMANVLQPYIEGRVDPNEGVLKININKKAARQIFALGLDEENRGDTGAIIGLLDSEVSLATGERTDLGPLIPQIEIQKDKVKIYFDE